MDTSSCYKSLLNQSVICHLQLAQKSLDALGKSVAAAHIDAAIQNLINISIMDDNASESDPSLGPVDTKMDVSKAKYKLTLSPNGKEGGNADFPTIGAVI